MKLPQCQTIAKAQKTPKSPIGERARGKRKKEFLWAANVLVYSGGGARMLYIRIKQIIYRRNDPLLVVLLRL